MSNLPLSVDYTNKDFDALRSRLFDLLKTVFPEWTDRNRANFGNILVELFAHTGDVLTYYQDNQARESRIVTATQRKSLLALCKLIGFAPATAAAAIAACTFSIPAIVAGDVVLPAGSFVATADVTEPVRFRLLTTVVITAGTTSVVGDVEHSEAREESFASTGLANQELLLASTPFLDGSLAVTAADGAYTQVDDFLSSSSVDRHFTVVVDQNDRARVRFGNGINGAVPVGTISAAYKVGGGEEGNVALGTISVVEGAFTDTLGTPVEVAVTNAAAASGGRPRATNAQIKALAPATVRAPERTVAREDFVINTLRLPQVARALMLTSNEDAGVPENMGHLYVIPQGGGAPSAALKTLVLEQVTIVYPCTLTFVPQVMDPVYRVVNVQCIVFMRQGYAPATVKESIITALSEWFAIVDSDGVPNTNVDFGANILDEDGNVDGELAWSDIFNVVRDTAGVRKVDPSSGVLLNSARANVVLGAKEFPVLGTVTVINGDTGATL